MSLHEIERRRPRKATSTTRRNTTDEHDVLVPDNVAAAEFGGVSRMTIHRWDRDARMIALGWPPRVMLNARGYRSRRQLEAFKANLLRRAIAARGERGEAA
jgi:hypothetical protein